MEDPRRPEAASGGVAALDRGLALLEAVAAGAPASLAALSDRTGLYKSTILRLSRSLIAAGLVERQADGRFRLGPGAARLGAAWRGAATPAEAVLPALAALAEATGESAAFYVPAGDLRVCVHRVESRHPIRYHVREGDALPLGIGSGGRVLSAFMGAEGSPYDGIRAAMAWISVGERDPETAGVSAPAFGPGGALAGAVTLAGPRSRVDAARLAAYRAPVLRAAAAATRALGGDPSALEAAAARG
jgi:DNA-binding IclR family transcriptional regulator